MAQVLAHVDLADPWAQSVLLAAGTARDGGAGGPLLQVIQESNHAGDRPFSTPFRPRLAGPPKQTSALIDRSPRVELRMVSVLHNAVHTDCTTQAIKVCVL